jgi:hypothetical protein
MANTETRKTGVDMFKVAKLAGISPTQANMHLCGEFGLPRLADEPLLRDGVVADEDFRKSRIDPKSVGLLVERIRQVRGDYVGIWDVGGKYGMQSQYLSYRLEGLPGFEGLGRDIRYFPKRAHNCHEIMIHKEDVPKIVERLGLEVRR